MKKGYYLKVRFKDKINGRKIWYMCNAYMCDCVNHTFESKAKAEEYIQPISNKYGKLLESITVHYKNL